MITHVTGTLQDVCNWDNLYEAYRAAARGKRGRESTALFEYRLEEYLVQIQQDLAYESYRPGKYTSFVIKEPKRRVISAAGMQPRTTGRQMRSVRPTWRSTSGLPRK